MVATAEPPLQRFRMRKYYYGFRLLCRFGGPEEQLMYHQDKREEIPLTSVLQASGLVQRHKHTLSRGKIFHQEKHLNETWMNRGLAAEPGRLCISMKYCPSQLYDYDHGRTPLCLRPPQTF